jgi:hypothetical protein
MPFLVELITSEKIKLMCHPFHNVKCFNQRTPQLERVNLKNVGEREV